MIDSHLLSGIDINCLSKIYKCRFFDSKKIGKRVKRKSKKLKIYT